MTSSPDKKKGKGKIASYAVLSLFAVALSASMPSAAKADPHHRGPPPRGFHDRDWRAHEGHRYWAQPAVVAAPPVVYAPPPVEESPGLNLIVPLHFH